MRGRIKTSCNGAVNPKHVAISVIAQLKLLRSDVLVFFFKKTGHCRPLFSLFSSFQYTVDRKQMFNINFCRWLDSNRGPLVSEATALPTEPQPLPKINVLVNVALVPFRIIGLVYFSKSLSMQLPRSDELVNVIYVPPLWIISKKLLWSCILFNEPFNVTTFGFPVIFLLFPIVLAHDQFQPLSNYGQTANWSHPEVRAMHQTWIYSLPCSSGVGAILQNRFYRITHAVKSQLDCSALFEVPGKFVPAHICTCYMGSIRIISSW